MSESDKGPVQEPHYIDSMEEFYRIFGSPHVEPPSAVDRLAAVVDPEAAERVREAEERRAEAAERERARTQAVADAMLQGNPLGFRRVVVREEDA